MTTTSRRKQPMSAFRAGVILIALVAIGTYFGFTKSIPFRHHFTIQAAFKSANNVHKNSPVRIAGVNVGKVTTVRFLRPNEQAAVVTMQINDTGLPIHQDATAMIRPRIFLEGNFFVDLHPGSPSSPTLHDGDMLPVNQTSAPVQLDQVLSVLHTSTRADLQLLLKELSTGLAAQGGAGLNRSIRYWGPAYRGGAIVNDATLGTQPHDLSGYIASSGAVAQALDASPPALKGLITNFNATAAGLSAHSADLSAAIAELPRTLQAGLPALEALNRAFPPVRRLAHDLRPSVRSLGPALDAGTPFVAQVRGLVSKAELGGLVSDLKPAVPALTQLNIASLPLYDQARLASSCADNVLLPWSKQTIQDSTFPATGPVYQEQFKTLPGLAGESRSGDANGQWFRVLAAAGSFAYPAGTNAFVLSSLPILGVNPPPPTSRVHPPLTLPNGSSTATIPCETQRQPDLRTTPLGPPPGEAPARLPNTVAAHARLARAQSIAVNWLRKQVKLEHLTNYLRVSAQPITASVIPRLRKLGTFLGGLR